MKQLCREIKENLSDETINLCKQHCLNDSQIQDIIDKLVHDFCSVQCEIQEFTCSKKALLWIAKHAKTVAFDNGEEVQTLMPLDLDYFTSTRALNIKAPYTMFYIDRYGNRLFRTVNRYRIEHFFGRGCIPPMTVERYMHELGITHCSHMPITLIIRDGLTILNQHLAVENAKRLSIVEDIEN